MQNTTELGSFTNYHEEEEEEEEEEEKEEDLHW